MKKEKRGVAKQALQIMEKRSSLASPKGYGISSLPLVATMEVL